MPTAQQPTTRPHSTGLPLAYGDAVVRLARIALTDTSGGRAAAQVLLSAYNGYNWHLDVTDLGLLDANALEDALTILRARAIIRIEPHDVINEGKRVFDAIARRWSGLHTSRRYGGQV